MVGGRRGTSTPLEIPLHPLARLLTFPGSSSVTKQTSLRGSQPNQRGKTPILAVFLKTLI